MIKKISIFALAFIITLAMCSCSKEEKQTSTNSPAPETTDKPVEQPTEKPIKKPHTTNYSESEVTEKVTVVVDGREITPTDNNGMTVEVIIHNGVVYLPVKIVADATGRSYYWDGPNFTAYLGDMDGELKHPTVELEDMVSITGKIDTTDLLTDNYGNRYSRAIFNGWYGTSLEYLLDMKYSKFKATLYMPQQQRYNSTKSGYFKIIADGKTIYTSPEMTKSSRPVNIDVDITGYNDVKLEFNDRDTQVVQMCLGEAGFYQ